MNYGFGLPSGTVASKLGYFPEITPKKNLLGFTEIMYTPGMEIIKRTIPIFFLLFCFLVAGVVEAGVVLCLGEDGHVLVETLHGEVCRNYSSSTHDADFKFEKHQKHCADFALSANGVEPLASEKALKGSVTSSAVADSVRLLSLRASGTLSVYTPLKDCTSLELLRSVVLLI